MSTKDVLLPDIGDFDEVEIIEILVAAGDTISAEDSLLTLESDKASMEIPSPVAGTIKEIKVNIGDKIAQGHLLLTVEESGSNTTAAKAEPEKQASPAVEKPAEQEKTVPAPTAPPAPPLAVNEPVRQTMGKAHASPSIRRFARELGVDLSKVSGTANKGRIVKADVQAFVKNAMQSDSGGGNGLQVLAMPEIDFSIFGEVDIQPLSRIKKISGANLHRNWVTIPHVTQFDEADITSLEEFRLAEKESAAKEGLKLTLLAFLIKGVVVALKEFPDFNASLDHSGENLVVKKFFNIGIAVDTPVGLLVPVIRNADKKGLFELATELGEISQKARDKKLKPEDMQGGTFSISSLGGVGGTAFTPIINAPEVAILGVSRSSMKPVYVNGEFVPRLILPLSLSYDHRVIDGARAARFTTKLSNVLSDIRQMLL